MAVQDKILEVRDLTVRLGGYEIIKDLSFSVERGEALIILGPNGAGKTTLLRAILGLLPYRGEVIWRAKKINYLPSQELMRRRTVLPLTVKEFFAFKRASLKATELILSQVGLDKRVIGQNLGTLSTGQFQRLMLAWSLVDKPEVLLLDEAMSGIDVGGQDTIYSLLHKFWRQGNLTLIFVTHELEIVWKHANHVLCLNHHGLCFGAPREVLSPQKLEELYGTGIKFYEHKHD